MAEFSSLGELKKIDMREYWSREDTEFTPWLSQEENLKVLGDVLGIPLSLVETESKVGSFRADILCTVSPTEDKRVIIENQIGKTDHDHLGKLLTYSAGVEATTIVWIASEFKEEHRAALEWLNDHTDDQFSAFGLEIELWQIDDSRPAPHFNMVVKPNNWQKMAYESISDAPRAQMRFDFWKMFGEKLVESGCRRKAPKPRLDNWVSYQSDGLLHSITITYQQISVELNLDKKDEPIFRHFENHRIEIEAEIGEPLEFDIKDGRDRVLIRARKECQLADRTTWPELIKWSVVTLDKMEQTFKKYRRFSV